MVDEPDKTPSDPDPRLKAIFDVALQTRNLEISLLWQRSLFFWGLISATFIAYVAAIGRHEPDNLATVSVASFGAICSLAWTCVNRGSKYWQQSWEAKLVKAENDALRSSLFVEVYKPDRHKRHFSGQWSVNWHFSVSRIAIALSDATFIIWLILTARAVPGIRWPECIIKSAVIVTPISFVFYGLLILVFARSKHD